MTKPRPGKAAMNKISALLLSVFLAAAAPLSASASATEAAAPAADSSANAADISAGASDASSETSTETSAEMSANGSAESTAEDTSSQEDPLAAFHNAIFTADGLRDFNAEAEVRKGEPVQTNEIEGWPQGPSIGAEGAVLMELDSGAILYGKNIDEKLYPASTTKILTCLLAVENLELTDMVTFSHEAVFSVPSDGSKAGIDEGESLTVEDCLYAILVGSANEASNAIAEKVAGSISAFAALMNKRAAELGCTGSHFVNANGLFDEDHYTTPHDLAIIARAFFSNPTLQRLGNTATHHFEPTATQPDDFWLNNTHALISGKIACDGIIGGKTGYTDQARRTLVTGCERNGIRMICIIMKEEDPYQYTDTINLFDYGYSNFQKVRAYDYEDRYSMDGGSFLDAGSSLFGSSSTPSFSLSQDSEVILPNTLSFSDLTATVTPVSNDNEQTAGEEQQAAADGRDAVIDQFSDGTPDTSSYQAADDTANAGQTPIAQITYSYGGIVLGEAQLYLGNADTDTASLTALNNAVNDSSDGQGGNNNDTDTVSASGDSNRLAGAADSGILQSFRTSAIGKFFLQAKANVIAFFSVVTIAANGTVYINVCSALTLLLMAGAVLMLLFHLRELSASYSNSDLRPRKKRRRKVHSYSLQYQRFDDSSK